MIATRVEKHVVKQSDQLFEMLDHFCFLSKNLYNHANFLIRKQFKDDGTWLRYEDLDKILKHDEQYPDYKNMCNSVAAQQLLRRLDDSWSAFFNAIKDWKAHPEKYLGKPNPPGYKHKVKGRCPIYLTNQACLLRESKYITFPKVFKKLKISVKFAEKENFVKFLQCRIVPRGNHIVIEFAYSIETPDLFDDNQRYIGIDIGVDNLAAVSNNVGLPFYIIDGKGLKSMNKYYNKLVAHYKSKLMKDDPNRYDPEKIIHYSSKRLQRIYSKRNAKVDDYMHKASRWIVNFAHENNINKIVVGKNDLWKQNSNLGNKNNQNFVQVPHQRFINMIKYKAEEFGIQVIEQEESHTSKTSFLDNEYPTHHEEYVGKRISRGRFRTAKGDVVNDDANAALQIIRKAFKDYQVEDLRQTRILLQRPQRINVS